MSMHTPLATSSRSGFLIGYLDSLALVERLLDRGVAADGGGRPTRQPGRCCVTGCQEPEPAKQVAAGDD